MTRRGPNGRRGNPSWNERLGSVSGALEYHLKERNVDASNPADDVRLWHILYEIAGPQADLLFLEITGRMQSWDVPQACA